MQPDTELDPPMDIKVTCKPCGGKFAMVDRGSRVLDALREWDKEHKHEEASGG